MLVSRAYKRVGPGINMAEDAERSVGATGVPPPPAMNAELELRKAICACAALTSAMPASAPISSTARTIPRCQHGSACLRVVRVAFIVIPSCFHTLPALACEKSPNWPVIDVQSRAGGTLRPTSGSAKLCVGASTARAPRRCRRGILAFGKRRLHLALDVAVGWDRGWDVRTTSGRGLIARRGHDLEHAHVAVTLRGVRGLGASHGHGESR